MNRLPLRPEPRPPRTVTVPVWGGNAVIAVRHIAAVTVIREDYRTVPARPADPKEHVGWCFTVLLAGGGEIEPFAKTYEKAEKLLAEIITKIEWG